MKAVWSIALLILATTSYSLGTISTSTFVNEPEVNKLERVLTPGLTSTDLQTIHYSVLGYNIIESKFPNVDDLCKLLIKSANNGKATPEILYYVTTTWKGLDGKCTGALPVLNTVKTLNELLPTSSSLQEIYHIVSSLVSLGQKPQNVDKLVSNIQTLIKKDDSLINLGYLFNTAALLGNNGAFAFQRIEDAIVQADEVDHVSLQFEGGLSVTALIVNGAYNLATSLNKAPAITPDQAVKFANYFLGRKSVQTQKGVYFLLQALKTFATNKFHMPVAVTLSSYPAVSPSDPYINIMVTDVIGNDLGELDVVAESITKTKDNSVFASKVKLRRTIAVSTVYTLNFSEMKPERGTYKIAVSANINPAEPRMHGPITTTVLVKATSPAIVDSVSIGTADVQQTTPSKLDKVEYPNKLSGGKIEIDTQQKLIMKFNIKDKNNNQLMAVHQCFVRFYNEKHDVEVVFVVEHDSALQYKFDLMIGDKAGEFDHVSGDYSVELIVGDAVLSNSFSWKIADVSLTFVNEPTIKSHRELYQPKPEIKHLFREAEKRPPLVVSNVFTGLLFVPLLILFALWLKIGINLSNFPFTLSALLFHIGFAGILLLFTWFWLELNMFQTVKYLLPLSVFTFLTGNRLLRHKSATS